MNAKATAKAEPVGAPSSAPLAGAGAGLCVVLSSCALAATTTVARRNSDGSKRRGANPDRDICEFDERLIERQVEHDAFNKSATKRRSNR